MAATSLLDQTLFQKCPTCIKQNSGTCSKTLTELQPVLAIPGMQKCLVQFLASCSRSE